MLNFECCSFFFLQGKKHRAGRSTPLKAQRQLAVTNFFSVAPAAASEGSEPSPRDTDVEDEVATLPPPHKLALVPLLPLGSAKEHCHLVCRIASRFVVGTH